MWATVATTVDHHAKSILNVKDETMTLRKSQATATRRWHKILAHLPKRTFFNPLLKGVLKSKETLEAIRSQKQRQEGDCHKVRQLSYGGYKKVFDPWYKFPGHLKMELKLYKVFESPKVKIRQARNRLKLKSWFKVPLQGCEQCTLSLLLLLSEDLFEYPKKIATEKSKRVLTSHHSKPDFIQKFLWISLHLQDISKSSFRNFYSLVFPISSQIVKQTQGLRTKTS